jgi:Flp pilus assembly protein TadD
VGQTINNLALVYRAQGKYGEAEELLKRALVILKKRSVQGPASVSICEL